MTRPKAILIGALTTALLLFGLQAGTATTAEAAGKCTTQRYTTLLGARAVYRVKCPSRDMPYRAVVECEFFGTVKHYGRWHWNNAWSTASCTLPYVFVRGWWNWQLR